MAWLLLLDWFYLCRNESIRSGRSLSGTRLGSFALPHRGGAVSSTIGLRVRLIQVA